MIINTTHNTGNANVVLVSFFVALIAVIEQNITIISCIISKGKIIILFLYLWTILIVKHCKHREKTDVGSFSYLVAVGGNQNPEMMSKHNFVMTLSYFGVCTPIKSKPVSSVFCLHFILSLFIFYAFILASALKVKIFPCFQTFEQEILMHVVYIPFWWFRNLKILSVLQ